MSVAITLLTDFSFQTLWDLWWTEWHWARFFVRILRFPLSVTFHKCSILIHSSTTDGVCFSPSTSVFPCQYHSTNAPYPFIHLPPTLYNVFSPSTSVFPCQYHSTNAPHSFIHLPPSLYNVFLPILQFSPVTIIPPLFPAHSFTYTLLLPKDKRANSRKIRAIQISV